ncbi:MAG: F0F1 ATP synthase subunit A [Alphaproteobacteria bacterium]|uniref:F0F1 ATP synthase subunit A n=1 Tax=Pacificispira sp. TaxID=2888761 RepID=UPI001B0E0DFE|nr:F0F1 ATP synthase subunit A [Alphaproteobacteria bacterium]MBO6862774.1 F0F1 ATP synthase subunit A [Alphaproteobacteria bacterium]MEC9265872.1 F0F1 ATP synthase subunit A [Pseudomonadota bacterium]
MAGPLEQFQIKSLVDGPVDAVAYTNSSLWMSVTVVVVTVFMLLGMSKREMVPGRWQSLAESMYEFVGNMIRDNVGDEGRKFFPFIFTLFMFILFGNLLGLIPGSFTFTSHIIVTLCMAMFVFLMVTLVGLAKHGLHFFSFFVPSGAPVALYPLMIPIEIISYLSRPVSLSVRLFANMMAGHTMLKVFAGFVFGLGAVTAGVGGILPIAMMVALTGFEILVAFLQAYVFAVLTCLYLNDALHLH